MNHPDKPGDEDRFTDLFGTADPVAGKDRELLRPPVATTPGLEHRRRDAAAEGRREDGLSTTDIPQLDAGAWLEYCRPGVQHGVYRKLRLGQYGPDARLDLHGKSLEEARRALLAFLRDCVAHDLRCALVAHGTGRGRNTPPVLKSALAHWLPQLDSVLAFHSAQRQHGGLGATYVLLKKSDRKRQETFEQHSRRKPR
jgi:DNA-nicking Smr family endonuclease